MSEFCFDQPSELMLHQESSNFTSSWPAHLSRPLLRRIAREPVSEEESQFKYSIQLSSFQFKKSLMITEKQEQFLEKKNLQWGMFPLNG